MVALWALEVVAYLSGFTLVVSPDLVTTPWAGALIHVCDVFFLRSDLSLGMGTCLWRRLVRMRGFPRVLHGFGFCFFLRGLSVGCGHDQSLC